MYLLFSSFLYKMIYFNVLIIIIFYFYYVWRVFEGYRSKVEPLREEVHDRMHLRLRLYHGVLLPLHLFEKN